MQEVSTAKGASVMRLLSDFHDYYDSAFDSRHADTPALERFAGRGHHRREDHALLVVAGFRLPARGTPVEVCRQLPNVTHVVVYTDPYAHTGEGKLLLPVEQAGRDHPDAYCTAFVGDPMAPGSSVRLLMVGDIPIWLTYSSRDDWRSNAGEDVIIEELLQLPVRKALLEELALSLGYPLVAIDFVEGLDRNLYAIDLNTAPGMKGTIAERHLRPSVVHEAIMARYARMKHSSQGSR
jgi:hypothetical protein